MAANTNPTEISPERLLQDLGIFALHSNATATLYQFSFLLDYCDALSVSCRGELRVNATNYQLRLQPLIWHNYANMSSDLILQWNEHLMRTWRYPPVFLWNQYELWLQAAIPLGRRMEHRVPATLLQMLQILQEKLMLIESGI